MILARRALFTGAAALIAAPSIVRASALMPVSVAALNPLPAPAEWAFYRVEARWVDDGYMSMATISGTFPDAVAAIRRLCLPPGIEPCLVQRSPLPHTQG